MRVRWLTAAATIVALGARLLRIAVTIAGLTAAVLVLVTALARDGYAPGADLPSSFSWQPYQACDPPMSAIRIDADLHGDLADPRRTWAVDRTTGRRMELLWPFGYAARFSPAFALLDQSGIAIAADGYHLAWACPGANGVLLVRASDIWR